MARPKLYRFLLSAGLLHLLVGCEDESVTKTCEKVDKCGGVVKASVCESGLADMVQDGRIEQERASTCAVCMANNECRDITSKRHCDTACEGVGYVENLFTSTCERARLCDSMVSACVDGAPKSRDYKGCDDVSLGCNAKSSDCLECATALADTVRHNPTLDQELDLCAACIEQTNAEPETAASEDTPPCTRLITRCRDVCATIGVVTETFSKAEAAMARQVVIDRLCGAKSACAADASDSTATCASGLRSQFADESPEDLGTLLEPCSLCYEGLACDVTTRDAACEAACAAVAHIDSM